MEYFVSIMKVLCNRSAYHERPLFRNVIFDSFRCLSAEVALTILTEGRLPRADKILPDLIGVVIMSILVNSFVKRKWFG